MLDDLILLLGTILGFRVLYARVGRWQGCEQYPILSIRLRALVSIFTLIFGVKLPTVDLTRLCTCLDRDLLSSLCPFVVFSKMLHASLACFGHAIFHMQHRPLAASAARVCARRVTTA